MNAIRTTNDLIPFYAVRGRDAMNSTGSFWTKSTPNGIRQGGYRTGYLPKRLRDIMHARQDSIVQVIYSYNTPIAWFDAGAWIIPTVTYSATTSAKHQSTLYRLSGEAIPADASLEEYMRVLNGQMRFVRDGKCLRTVAA